MLELFPGGFAEVEGERVELAAYTDAAGEERLRAAFGCVATEEVADDWAERWREFHRGVRIGPLWVGPPWEAAPSDAIAVVIEPGRAFGTGAHATTRLCLGLIAALPRGSLLDVGCGSGVLAVAAARLGFSPVFAIDYDPAAVETALANAGRNDVRVEVALANLHADELPAADVAVANVALPEVEMVAGRLRCGHLVTSGYLADERPRLRAYDLVERRTAEGWAAELYRRDDRAR
jgi:ribosomal protein L11 methyltransferase